MVLDLHCKQLGFCIPEKISSSEISEFLGACGSGGGEGRQETAAFGGELVTVSLCDPVHQTMIHEQTQQTCDSSGLAAMLGWISGRAKQGVTKVAVAKAVDGEFASQQYPHQLRVYAGHRVQTA